MYKLDAYDRNSNFGRPTSLDSEFTMSLPTIDFVYKDLHADVIIPNILLDIVNTYLHSYNKVIDKKFEDLYNSGFINYVRVTKCKVTDKFFFKAECWASCCLLD